MKNIKLITNLMMAILAGIQFSYGQLEAELEQLASKACIGYTIEMSNFNAGDQIFRYFDCDGLEVEITQAQKTGVMTYSFCGLENQDIQREFVSLPGDTFNATEGACNLTPILREYTAPLISSDGGDRPKSRQEGEPFNAKVFPNPTNGNATLTWDEDEVTTLTIVDLSGKKVLNQIIAKGTTSASFTINDPGVYFALIEQNGEKKWFGKMVKL